MEMKLFFQSGECVRESIFLILTLKKRRPAGCRVVVTTVGICSELTELSAETPAPHPPCSGCSGLGALAAGDSEPGHGRSAGGHMTCPLPAGLSVPLCTLESFLSSRLPDPLYETSSVTPPLVAFPGQNLFLSHLCPQRALWFWGSHSGSDGPCALACVHPLQASGSLLAAGLGRGRGGLDARAEA